MEPGHVLLGKYRILECVGRGGMGAVYRAESLMLGKVWAIKELSPPFQDPDELHRYAVQFQQEARLLALLDHPGLPRVVDFFEDAHNHFLVMDFISGLDLEGIVQAQGAIPHGLVQGWAEEILDILEYLHGLDPPIIVRDIKPSNLMLTNAGRIKMIDFGIAKTASSRTGTAIRGSGTPGFAPIEQYGHSGTDARTDVYGLGATLYYLLSGVIPPDSLQRLVSDAPLVPLTQLNAELPPQTWQVIERMLGIQPAARYPGMAHVRAALAGNPLSEAIQPAPMVVETSAPTLPPQAIGVTLPPSQMRAPSAARPSIIHPTDGSELSHIPAGTFWMGSPDHEGAEDERPRTEVFLPEFYIGRYPITCKQFARFVETTGYETGSPWDRHADDALPVSNVCLYDALAYCAWAGLRLPTEAEWEKVASGAEGRRYPWGDRWDAERCNNWNLERARALAEMRPLVAERGLVPGGVFPDGASPSGVLDLAGNLLEWTQSIYAPYPYNPEDGRESPPPERRELTYDWLYVLRGGAWNMSDRACFRNAARFASYPGVFSPNRGFRVALTR